jgi:outer membrane protein
MNLQGGSMSRSIRPVIGCWWLALGLGASLFLGAQEPAASSRTEWTLQGDLGLGAFAKQSHVVGRENGTSLLPFGYATWGRLFWRVDTLGIETWRFGHGALELVGRIDLENSTNTQGDSGLFKRENAIPVGLGTFQRTSWGGLFAHVYQDVGASRGQTAEVRYAARLAVSSFVLYPQVAMEWRSASFNQTYYGLAPGNSQGLPVYHSGASVNPVLAVAGEWPITGAWVLNAQVRRKWLAASVADSPRVRRGTVDDGYLALSYRFK